MTRTRLILTAFVLFIVYACSKGGGTDAPPGGGGGGTPGGGGGGTANPGCTGTPGALFTAVKSVLQSHCAVAGCHVGSNAQNGLDFSNSCTIVSQATRIRVRAVDEAGTPNQMPQPPNPALSTEDRKKITDWIAAGGKITD